MLRPLPAAKELSSRRTRSIGSGTLEGLSGGHAGFLVADLYRKVDLPALRGVTYPSTSGREAQKEFHTGVFQGPVQDCKMSSLQLILGYSQSFRMDRQSPPSVHSKKGNCDWYFVTSISSVLPSCT
uniref:Uncharacterized protein n=1 Tax=Pipistrellus kuhlii TaxID=59472 RepID=A0A7J7VBE8_PIPKU|nr:hypothetical protein mPipKuh1_008523 [Pipistrellus kuhlii]